MNSILDQQKDYRDFINPHPLIIIRSEMNEEKFFELWWKYMDQVGIIFIDDKHNPTII